MTTVAELQADLANILSRDDIASDFAMHLRLAHARINRDVRCRAMEHTVGAIPGTDGATVDQYTELDLTDLFAPEGTLMAVTTVAYGRVSTPRQLTRVSSEQMYEDAAINGTPGKPTRYSLGLGSAGQWILTLNPAVASGDTEILVVSGYVAFTLDSENPPVTNWLLTNHYDVYLYALAAAACGTIQDFERQRQYLGMYQAAVAEVAKTENQARTGGSVIERQGGDNDGYRV